MRYKRVVPKLGTDFFYFSKYNQALFFNDLSVHEKKKIIIIIINKKFEISITLTLINELEKIERASVV